MKITNVNPTYTIIDNDTIDGYFIKANGEYLKVYLMLARIINNSAATFDNTDDLISTIADRLSCTEKNVIEAIDYWSEKGLIITDFSSPSSATSSSVASSEFKQLLFVADAYIGRKLSKVELNSLFYIYNDLNFSFELCEYLLEYCCEREKRDIRYIKKVAEAWHEKGIKKVAEARNSINPYYSPTYKILAAFHVSGRAPASIEVAYCEKWMKQYEMPLDMILEACKRTLKNTHKVSFEYCDKMLYTWQLDNVNTLEELHNIDNIRSEKKNKVQEKISSHTSSFSGWSIDELEGMLLNTK